MCRTPPSYVPLNSFLWLVYPPRILGHIHLRRRDRTGRRDDGRLRGRGTRHREIKLVTGHTAQGCLKHTIFYKLFPPGLPSPDLCLDLHHRPVYAPQAPNMMMMAAHVSPAQVTSRSSSVIQEQSLDLAPLSLSSLIRTRSARRRTVCLSATVKEQFPKQQPSLRRRSSILRKLAGPRENAKRFLRLRSAGIHSPTPAPQQRLNPRCSGARPVSEIIISPSGRTRELLRSLEEGDMRQDSSSMATDIFAPALPEHTTAVPDLSAPFPRLRNEKIVATGSGLTVGIALTEPVLFLQGYDQNDPSTKKSAILRGQIHLKVTKCVKIKKISICFRGHAQTDWPDGALSSSLLTDQSPLVSCALY